MGRATDPLLQANVAAGQEAARQSAMRKELARKGLYFFASVYLDHLMRFKDGHPRAGQRCDSGQYGRDLCAAVDRAIQPKHYLYGAIPREHAKSTMGTIANVLRLICLGLKRNIVIVGANQQEAMDKLSQVVQELENNPLLIADYGTMIRPKTDMRGATVQARDNNILFNNGVRVRAIAFGAKIRGQLSLNSTRMDCCILDDPESDYQVESETERRKMWNWYLKSLFNSMQKESGSIIWLGTILHHDSLLNRALAQYDGKRDCETLRYGIYREDGTPLWPESWSPEEIEERKALVGPFVFACEYLNNPIDEESQIFKADYWRFFNRADLRQIDGRWYHPNPLSDQGELLPLVIFEGNDPALGLDKQHDYSAWFTWGRQEETNLIFVLEVGHGRLTTTAWLDGMERRWMYWRTARIGIENVAFQALLGQQAIQRGLPVVSVRPITKKKERAQTAAIPFEQGRVLLPRDEPATRAFCEEAEFFPNGKNDDMVDSMSVAFETGNFLTERVLRCGTKRRSNYVVQGFQHEQVTGGY